MKRKYSYITTPALCWCIINKKDMDKVLKKGLVPKVRTIKDLPGHEHKKILYAVRLGDTESLERLKRLTGIENDVLILKVAVPTYYTCIREEPETVSEIISCKENGVPHQGILFIPDKIKPRYIIDMQGSDQDAVSYAETDSVPELNSDDNDNKQTHDQQLLELPTS